MHVIFNKRRSVPLSPGVNHLASVFQRLDYAIQRINHSPQCHAPSGGRCVISRKTAAKETTGLLSYKPFEQLRPGCNFRVSICVWVIF